MQKYLMSDPGGFAEPQHISPRHSAARPQNPVTIFLVDPAIKSQDVSSCVASCHLMMEGHALSWPNSGAAERAPLYNLIFESRRETIKP
jgi:hypothetical protein